MKRKVSYIEGIKEDQYWNLQHADLYSDTTSHLQAEEIKINQIWNHF